MVSNFFGTEIVIWAGFGPISSTEKILAFCRKNGWVTAKSQAVHSYKI
jgi:hypothetical protein